jgi:hypothetical protein
MILLLTFASLSLSYMDWRIALTCNGYGLTKLVNFHWLMLTYALSPTMPSSIVLISTQGTKFCPQLPQNIAKKSPQKLTYGLL